MADSWFVTGSSRGLGREIVDTALKRGCNVVATARHTEDLTAAYGNYTDRFLALKLDVTDAAAVARAVKTAADRFGRIDVVVNNAGYANIAALEDVELDDFARQVETNFFGVVYVTKAVLPILRHQGSGHIFQIASVGSRVVTPGLSAYQSAKFAVRGFSLVLAKEVAPLGIKVTTVQPGGMRTDWAGSSMEIPTISPPYRETVGQIAEMVRGMDGQQVSDPRRIAEVIIDLSQRDDAPTEILMGEDALAVSAQVAEAVAEADRRWRDLSASVSKPCDRA